MDRLVDVPKIVIIESPYRGDFYKKTVRNILYARLCVRDSLMLRGEIPFASHLFYAQTGITDDMIPKEREFGMVAGWEIGKLASLSAFYVDFGWSSGMRNGMTTAINVKRPVEERSLGNAEEVTSMIEKLVKIKSSANDGIPF